MMAKLRLVLVRHGETDANAEGRIQGQTPPPAFPLSDTGLAQAEKLRARFEQEGLEPTHVYASPLPRARETAEIVARQWPAPIAFSDDLMEHDLGIVSGLTREEIPSKHPDIDFALESERKFAGVEGAESLEQRRDRGRRVVETVVRDHTDGDVVVMFAHGGIIQNIVAAVLQTRQAWGIPVQNTAVFDFTIDPVAWTRDSGALLGNGFHADRFNDASHLDGPALSASS